MFFVRRRSCAFLLCSTILILLIYVLFNDRRAVLNVPSQQLFGYLDDGESHAGEEIKEVKELPRDLPSNVYETEDNFEEEGFKENDDPNGELANSFRKWIINAEREFIKEETRTYHFPSSKILEDFVPEEGGQQVRNFILSTWRSGSSFVAEILRSLPGTFYNFEPLVELGTVQVNDGPEADEALKFVRSVLNCDFSDLSHSTEKGENMFLHWILGRNPRLWQLCKENRKACMESNFLSRICKLHPFQIMKTVRLTLGPAKELLKDPSLNIKLLLVVRDPRGIMPSRARMSWCRQHPACDDPKILCTDLVDDYHQARELTTKYPKRFMFIRYEDIALNVFSNTERIFKFFGLESHPEVTAFLEGHTKSRKGGTYSTYRDSQGTPLKWLKEIAAHNFSTLKEIQDVCEEALQVWGYNKLNSVEDLKDFNPLGKPRLPEMII